MHSERVALIVAGGFYALVVWLSAANELFWDSILLTGKYAYYYYENNFASVFVPEEIAGYPPLWGFYIAGIWKLSGGPTLLGSHLAMWPLLMLMVYNATQLIDAWQLKSPKYLLLGFLLAEPVLLAQATQVAPDIALTAFALGGLAAIYRRKPLALGLYLLLLIWLSPRGGFHALALVMVAAIHVHTVSGFKSTLKEILIPAVAFVVGVALWYIPHFWHYGWVGYKPQSDWAAYTEQVDFAGFIKNVAVLLYRFADMNRWVILFILIWTIWKYWLLVKVHFKQRYPLLIVFMILLGVQLPVWLSYSNPIGHRYLIVPFVILSWYVSELLFAHKKLYFPIIMVMLLALISGHFIAPPAGRSRGWDATLAHLPYFGLKQKAWHYIAQQHKTPDQVCTWFPANESQQYLLLNDSSVKPGTCTDSSTSDYILWSNVFNIKQKPDTNSYVNIWQENKGQVTMEIWLRKP